MKNDGLDFESRLAEAVKAALGWDRKQDHPGRVTEEFLGGSVQSGEGEGFAALFGTLLTRLEGLARPAATDVSGWQGAMSSINPLLGGLLSLFRGGGEDAPARLPLAARPAAARYELGYEHETEGYFSVDRDASGAVRAAPPRTPAVVVNIEAVDSRSFLERTPEIAEAVKRAVLEAEGMREVFNSWRE